MKIKKIIIAGEEIYPAEEIADKIKQYESEIDNINKKIAEIPKKIQDLESTKNILQRRKEELSMKIALKYIQIKKNNSEELRL